MTESTVSIDFIKDRMKDAWSSGDFGVIAQIIAHEGEAFIKRLNIPKGSTVLDVACGTGNLSIPAARAGAKVTGLDLVQHLIAQANERARKENLNAVFVTGDAEDMPFDDGKFDYVVSMFGAMFGPRPEIVTSELLRVCKPGGIITMANWTPEGSEGDMFRLNAKYVPPPPGLEFPALWGNEEVVRKRFGDNVKELRMQKRLCRQHLFMTPAEVVEHFRKYFGPLQKAFELLDEEGKRNFRNEMTEIWKKYNIAKDGTTIVDAEYLEIVAVKK